MSTPAGTSSSSTSSDRVESLLARIREYEMETTRLQTSVTAHQSMLATMQKQAEELKADKKKLQEELRAANATIEQQSGTIVSGMTGRVLGGFY